MAYAGQKDKRKKIDPLYALRHGVVGLASGLSFLLWCEGASATKISKGPAIHTEAVDIASTRQLCGSDNEVLRWLRAHAQEIRQTLVQEHVLADDDNVEALFTHVYVEHSTHDRRDSKDILYSFKGDLCIFVPIVPEGTKWIVKHGRAMMIGYQDNEPILAPTIELVLTKATGWGICMEGILSVQRPVQSH